MKLKNHNRITACEGLLVQVRLTIAEIYADENADGSELGSLITATEHIAEAEEALREAVGK